MHFTTYEDSYCYYVRKPAGWHTTFGQEYSFLERLRDETSDPKILEIIRNGQAHFGEKVEFGLLNRLDTPTSGLLYFAKTPKIKHLYKSLQKQGQVHKYYLLEAWGDVGYYLREKGNLISEPIAHHRFADDRMVVVSDDSLISKTKGSLHHVKTEIKEYTYDESRKVSVVMVMIEKGIRHQIRSHFSSIGYPLVGDEIYGKKKDPFKGALSLRSIGLQIKEE